MTIVPAILLLMGGWLAGNTLSAFAQTTNLVASTGGGSLGTTVTPPAIPHGHTFQITGGTRSDHGTGANLFHSFNQFNVGQSDTAQFLNTTPTLHTENILVRVIGDTRSTISGTIDTTSYSGANLFLMNPAGIVFGPNATLHVGGSVAFTTAAYLRLAKADGSQAQIFDAHTTANGILTSAPVAAFGFLDHEQTAIPAAITVQGSALEVSPGKSLSLVGGKVVVEFARLGNLSDLTSSALARQILIASAASSGEVLAGTLDRAPNIKGQSFGDLGTVQILKQSLIDASGERGGRIRISGGQLVVDDSILGSTIGDISLAGTSILVTNATQIGTFTTTNNNAGHISLEASGDITIDSKAHVFSFSRDAWGDAGNIKLSSDHGDVLFSNRAAVTSQTFLGRGNSGTIQIDAMEGDVRLDNSSIFTSAMDGTGTIGGIQLRANNVHLLRGSAIVGNNFSKQVAGNIEILLAGRLYLAGGSVLQTTTIGPAAAADLTIEARDILLTDGSQLFANTTGLGAGGRVSIRDPASSGAMITIDGPGSGIFTGTEGSGHGGTIDLSVKSLTIRNGGTLSATTSGPVRTATGGSIAVQATDHVTMTGGAAITASTSGPADAGEILIKATDVSITDGAKITAESTGTGNAGTVTIQGFNSPANSFLLDGAGSSILTSTAQTGAGGNILIHAKDVMFRNGGKVSAETFGASSSATGGTIAIQGDHVRIESGALVTSSTSGAAKGGAINLTARESVSINDGATISASSTGLGDAGNISIHAGQRFTSHNGFVTTSAKQSSGGDIDIRASDLVSLINGRISTSVLGGAGNGGNISIDPNMVVLQNKSQIVANAIAGHGGNIAITTPLFLADQSSLVDASSLFGLNGRVTIQSPISNLSGTVGQLTSQPSPVHLLVQNRCVALANGQPSTLIVGGRQTFSTTPGGWASSPMLMALGTGEPLGVRSDEKKTGFPFISESEILSLRELTPQGFLVRSFANDVQTGCRL